MSIITLDFETPYGKGARQDHILHKYSLSSMTYEQYLRDPRFKVFGCAIKVDSQPTAYKRGNELTEYLEELFHVGNDHTMVAHNALFDGAILSWYYKLSAARYWCTQAMSRAIWNQRSSSLKQLCISCYPDDESIRKTDELEDFKNVYYLNPQQETAMERYCLNDTDITFKCLELLWPVMPDMELEVLDMTLKMFIHPAFVLDRRLVAEFLENYDAETKEIIDSSGVSRTILASRTKFAQWVKENLDIDIPIIASPTPANPSNTKFALGKDEREFVDLQADNPEHQHIWNARMRVASTIDSARATRMLEHGAVCEQNPEGLIAAPLHYAAAHTMRWGGANKINLQNLKRGSKLRQSLRAPEGYKVVVADLSAIEVRMNAWFCQEHQMLNVFATQGDLYNDFASGVFKRPINRKEVDENGKQTQWMEGFLGKTCILGLQYQTGPAKLKSTLYLQTEGAINLTLEECKTIVYQDYRERYTQIVKGWADAEVAIQQMYLLPEGESWQWNCLSVEKGRIRLPNGMYLNYPDLRVEMDELNRSQFSYWNGKHATNLYGGKLIENLVQALARVVLAEMMVHINRHLLSNTDMYGEKARVVLTVHDEIIAIVKTEHAQTAFENLLQLMSVPPKWCSTGNLVLAAEGGWDDSYSK